MSLGTKICCKDVFVCLSHIRDITADMRRAPSGLKVLLREEEKKKFAQEHKFIETSHYDSSSLLPRNIFHVCRCLVLLLPAYFSPVARHISARLKQSCIFSRALEY